MALGSLDNFKFLHTLGFRTDLPYWNTGNTDWEVGLKIDGFFRHSFARKKDKQVFIFDKFDCRDFDAMMIAMKDVDVVYHCAATAHEGLSVFSPSFITKNIYEASVAVVSAAIACKVKRFVYMSSMSRYGKGYYKSDYQLNKIISKYGTDIVAFHEDLETRPVDPYGIAKVAAEETLKCLSEVHGMEYIIAVPHNIIGLRQNYTDPHRNVASIMMNRLKQGKDVIIYGDGNQTRCFSPVADNIHCLARMANLSDKSIVGEVINIGPDERGAITVNQLAQKLYGLAGKVFNPIYHLDRPREVKHAACSSNKARRLLGYVEQQSLDACLLEMWNDIPQGGKPFIYDDKPLEIINDKTPETWKNRLI